MNYLQKIEIGVEKIAFQSFYIFAFCSLTDRPTDKIFIEQMLIYERNMHTKIQLYLNQGPRKSRFPLNLTDINNYRVASLLKKRCFTIIQENLVFLSETCNDKTDQREIHIQSSLASNKFTYFKSIRCLNLIVGYYVKQIRIGQGELIFLLQLGRQYYKYTLCYSFRSMI